MVPHMQRQTEHDGEKAGDVLMTDLTLSRLVARMIHFPRHGSKGLIYFPSNFRLRHGLGGRGFQTRAHHEGLSVEELMTLQVIQSYFVTHVQGDQYPHVSGPDT